MVTLTGGSRNDLTQLIPLIEAVPPHPGPARSARRKPRELFADRGYDHDKYRRLLRARGITPRFARRGVVHGSGLADTACVLICYRSYLGLCETTSKSRE